MTLLFALLLGLLTGLRAMTPLAAVSWAARTGAIAPPGWLAVLGHSWTPWVLTLFALGELVTDQLPGTPSRKVPVQFGTRILAGAVCGMSIAPSQGLWAGAVAGGAGAVIGTLGGAAARGRLAAAFGRDRPAALIEDAVAILGAVLVVSAL